MGKGRICKIASWGKKSPQCETLSGIIDTTSSTSQCHR